MSETEQNSWRNWPFYVGGYYIAGCIAVSQLSDSFRFVAESSAVTMLSAGLLWAFTQGFVVERRKGPLMSGAKYYLLLWVLSLGIFIYNHSA